MELLISIGQLFQSLAASILKLDSAIFNFAESLKIRLPRGLSSRLRFGCVVYGSSEIGLPTTFRAFHTSWSFIVAANWFTDRS